MADLVVSELVIASHAGPYRVAFSHDAPGAAVKLEPRAHYLIDSKVAGLYQKELDPVLSAPSVLRIEASEEAKSLSKFEGYIDHLVGRGVRRGDALVAIGGGVIQDITCFLAATLLRGLDWRFYPTTLLAQADSCIGSKSSINVKSAKNILGTFTPPKEIVVLDRFLGTLLPEDVRSGVGEMLKVHAIEGPEAFDEIARDYERLFSDSGTMARYIRRSLEIKKRIIELDEFDRGLRNVMNYGHTFGHAIESATDYAIPHGIAVTIGMDMANFVATRLGLTTEEHFRRMHPALRRNYEGFEETGVPMERFLSAIAKDKKNTQDKIGAVFPDASGKIAKRMIDNNEKFRSSCGDFFRTGRLS